MTQVICKVRADMVDLMIEADRTDYIMQIENQPFGDQHQDAETAFARRLTLTLTLNPNP